jgi:hypothetical protein
MSDISLKYKINLKNKYLNKIIKNFDKVNNSLELINEFNNKINRQYGGNLSTHFNEINNKIDTVSKPIDEMIKQTEKQLNELNELSSKIVTGLIEAHNKLEQIPFDTKVDTTDIQNQIKRISEQIIGQDN